MILYRIRIISILSCASVIVAASSFANLGETEDELKGRYGEVIGQEIDAQGNRRLQYTWNKMVVLVHIEDHVSQYEEIFKIEDESFSEDDIRLLLQLHSAGVGWRKSEGDEKEGERTWFRLDKKASASYRSKKKRMDIISLEFVNKHTKEK